MPTANGFAFVPIGAELARGRRTDTSGIVILEATPASYLPITRAIELAPKLSMLHRALRGWQRPRLCWDVSRIFGPRRCDNANRSILQSRCYGLAHTGTESLVPLDLSGLAVDFFCLNFVVAAHCAIRGGYGEEEFPGPHVAMAKANCNDQWMCAMSHSAARARATHGRTQTNKTTTMIPISTPAIASIPTSRMPSCLVIVVFTFEVRGGGKRREEGNGTIREGRE